LNTPAIARNCGASDAGVMTMAMVNPFKFVQETRAEVAKVVWPTRREVLLTTVMVFILSAITAAFFSLVDILIKTGLQATLAVFGS
jgi:preprotein translocase subunit SecE